MRTAARNDDNQTKIVSALREAGFVVWIIRWPVDLLVRCNKAWLPMEVKDGDKPPSARELTPDQAQFVSSAGLAPVAVVTDIESALRAARML